MYLKFGTAVIKRIPKNVNFLINPKTATVEFLISKLKAFR